MPSLAQKLFLFSGGAAPEPVIEVTGTFAFGNVGIASDPDEIITVSNVLGTADLIVTAINLPSGYTHDAVLPWTIEAGTSETFTLIFDAEYNASGYAGNMEIVSNAPTVTQGLTARIWAFYASGASDTAEIGTATRLQTDGTIASNGTKFAYTAQATPVWGDLSIRSQLIPMIADAAMVMVGVINQSTRQLTSFGWYPTNSIGIAARLADLTLTALLRANEAGTTIANSNTFNADTDYPIAVIARDTDADANAEEYHSFVRIAGVWKRLWVIKDQNDASMYAGFANHSAIGTLEKFKVEPLPSSVYNPPVSLLGAISAGQTWTAPNANFFLRKVLTTRPSAASEIMKFRVQDANNYLVNSIDSAGLQTLEKVVAGVATALGSGGAAVNGSVIKLTTDGTNVRSNVGATQSYSVTVTEFATATGGELNALGTGGAVSDIEVWELNASGSVHTQLEAVLNG